MKIQKQRTFPANLFDFSEYNGMKTLVAFILALSILYFLSGIWGLFAWQDSWYWPDSIHKVASFVFHFFVLVTVYCLAWLTFDKTSFEGYILSFFSFVFGIVYIISPFDLIPDVVPGLSAIDDALVGGGSIFMSVLSHLRAKKKSEQTKDAIRMFEQGNNLEALRIFFIANGIAIEDDEHEK